MSTTQVTQFFSEDGVVVMGLVMFAVVAFLILAVILNDTQGAKANDGRL